MGLKVIHDGWESHEPKERCCLCRVQTQYWHKANDVALCQSCATNAKLADLPTKQDWCSKERAISMAEGVVR